ncbi:selenocysteine-specific translation elongation factor [Caldalkalibacillus salinus]|uniref:selenocysteine-specific translation elongation factor n=1 Tax=Caldalkalibacillus salinus TaxID=2803787 RepID=UPI0019236B9D|nr:selenocysteine-specific translation elongation factor [Caldalkalibacillus salinus]
MTQEAITEQHYTLGIAGHIDHGKSTLTKALTGKVTDRLKEEQDRNISIELGFASFPLSNGKNVGVVDVPGHERFIRQMVAGVAGIDMVLLVIAADEGVMPQTKEHIDILNLLGIKRGLIVLTKVDAVDEEFLELVRESVREETAHTFLQEASIHEVDSLSGKGIDLLKQEIEAYMAHVPARPIHGIARLPIDRVFTKKGFGTIVTGTMYQGKVSVGDELDLLPSGKNVKVRNIQVHDQPRDSAYAGQRVAVNISDVHVDDVHRGDVLVTKDTVEPTQRIDIELKILDDLDFELKQRSEVRLHIGTAEVLSRLILFDRNELQPGDTCYAQLELKEPITTLFEERFVLRRPTPMTTIGGGSVIDPYATKHKFGADTIEQIAMKKEGDIGARAAHVLEQSGVIPLSELTHQLGVSQSDWEQDISSPEEKGLKQLDDDKGQQTLLTTLSFWENIWQGIQEELDKYHKRYPLREGIERVQLQKRYFSNLATAQWNLVLKVAEQEEKVAIKQELVSSHGFTAVLKPKDQEIWENVKSQMDNNPIEVPVWSSLLPSDMPAERQEDLQRLLLRRGEVVSLGEDRVLYTPIFERLVSDLQKQTPETFAIADVRPVFNTSRKYLIPFLEALDAHGYTVRRDNERTWRSNSE